jgi:hypothetical protein
MYVYGLSLKTAAVRSTWLAAFSKINPLRLTYSYFFRKEIKLYSGNMLLSLACLSDTDDDNESSLFRYRLKKQFRIKRVHRISWRALLDPRETGFIKLYQSGCMQSMITYT